MSYSRNAHHHTATYWVGVADDLKIGRKLTVEIWAGLHQAPEGHFVLTLEDDASRRIKPELPPYVDLTLSLDLARSFWHGKATMGEANPLKDDVAISPLIREFERDMATLLFDQGYTFHEADGPRLFSQYDSTYEHVWTTKPCRLDACVTNPRRTVKESLDRLVNEQVAYLVQDTAGQATLSILGNLGRIRFLAAGDYTDSTRDRYRDYWVENVFYNAEANSFVMTLCDSDMEYHEIAGVLLDQQ